MTLPEGTDDPAADRERFMRTACLSYLIAATDAHAKNFSLLYSRGAERSDLATRLPDEASTIMAERRNSSLGSQMLHLFLDGLASNCKSMLLRLGRAA
jgi:hypothetical protein